MISDFELNDTLSKVLFFGFSKCFSEKAIEEMLLDSSFISSLENNGVRSYLVKKTNSEIVEETYGMCVDEKSLNKSNNICDWISFAYLSLFYHFKKPFSYLFLIISLYDMVEMFPVYHEMDINQLFNQFLYLEKDSTILKRLLKKENLSIRELSILTEISENTLRYYASDDKNIYEASFNNIMQISEALNVDAKIFLKKINVYRNDNFLKRENASYRAYFGMLLISYYFPQFDFSKYVFDESKKQFISKEDIVIFTKTPDPTKCYIELFNDANPSVLKLIDEIDNEENANIVIFEFDALSENDKAYSLLMGKGFKNIFIINAESIINVNKKRTKRVEILDQVNVKLVEKAKSFINFDEYI